MTSGCFYVGRLKLFLSFSSVHPDPKILLSSAMRAQNVKFLTLENAAYQKITFNSHLNGAGIQMKMTKAHGQKAHRKKASFLSFQLLRRFITLKNLERLSDFRPLDDLFSYFSTKTYLVRSQENRPSETVSCLN